jgi:hypothetical protein
LAQLLTATSATLVIDNQKNGIRGQCIHHQFTGLPTSLVRSLAYRLYHIMSTFGHNQSLSILEVDGSLAHFFAFHINAAVKQAVAKQGLLSHGFILRDVSSHPLRADGVMALKLHGYDRDTIKKWAAAFDLRR